MIENQEVDVRQDYLKYMQTTFRFFHRYTRPSVLLYDKDFRGVPKKEGLPWTASRRDIQDFQLVAKPIRAAEDSSAPNTNNKQRKRGPFLPNRREICRRFNVESCDREKFNCRLAHNCTLCFSTDHPATQHPVPSKK